MMSSSVTLLQRHCFFNCSPTCHSTIYTKKLPLYNLIPVCSSKDASVMSIVDYCIKEADFILSLGILLVSVLL